MTSGAGVVSASVLWTESRYWTIVRSPLLSGVLCWVRGRPVRLSPYLPHEPADPERTVCAHKNSDPSSACSQGLFDDGEVVGGSATPFEEEKGRVVAGDTASFEHQCA